MIPQSIAAFTGFLLLIAPGAFFELLREGRRPSRTTSALREVSRVILASVVLSGVAVAVLAAVRAWRPELMPDPGAWLRDGRHYLNGHYRLIARTAAVELVIALSLGWAVHRVLTGRNQSSNRGENLWRTLFLSKLPMGARASEAFVRVEVEGGGVYFGTVSEFSNDFKWDDRDLALAPPELWYKPDANTPPASLVDKQYTRVILPATAIKSIWISYQPRSIPGREKAVAKPPRQRREGAGAVLRRLVRHGRGAARRAPRSTTTRS